MFPNYFDINILKPQLHKTYKRKFIDLEPEVNTQNRKGIDPRTGSTRPLELCTRDVT